MPKLKKLIATNMLEKRHDRNKLFSISKSEINVSGFISLRVSVGRKKSQVNATILHRGYPIN